MKYCKKKESLDFPSEKTGESEVLEEKEKKNHFKKLFHHSSTHFFGDLFSGKNLQKKNLIFFKNNVLKPKQKSVFLGKILYWGFQKLKISWRFLIFGLLIFFLIFCLLPILWMHFSTREQIFTLENAPSERVALVFGAAIWGNRPSSVFADRLLTAADLMKTGKIEKILISGDNSLIAHNEPRVGEMFLREQGIFPENIILDYAGFRTYDSCARAKRIFGIDSALLVTQEFHLTRAVFLCEKMGISAKGVTADRQNYQGKTRNFFRENAAKAWSFFEATIFFHDPKFLGEKVEI